MISNTNCSELTFINKIDLLSNQYKKKFELITNKCDNSGQKTNNSIMRVTPAALQMQGTKHFTFSATATLDGVDRSIGRTKTEYTAIVIPPGSNEAIFGISKSQVALPNGLTNNLLVHESCTAAYTSKRETNIINEAFNNSRNDSALNGISQLTATKPTISDSIHSCMSSIKSQSDKVKSPMCRTEDQENAFRQIEDVHNYSKLNRYGYSSCRNRTTNAAVYSSNSSNQDEDEYDDVDDEPEDEEEEDDEEGEEDFEDGDLDFEQNFEVKIRKISESRNSETVVKPVKSITPAEQIHYRDQDMKFANTEVEESSALAEDEANTIPPDHHARRPMNAFLIFCKRHRGIVKDKYKNLENRAITKILGEWWASLELNDKKCYVNLANQNKAAFFSANPNFKWYKLPAPPLRTLNTRPCNFERSPNGSKEYHTEMNESLLQCSPNYNTQATATTYSRNEPRKVSYFKLADEAQMGELNNLMRPTTSLPAANETLQEVLSETSDFFKTGHKRKSFVSFDDASTKKHRNSDSSFSSSEEDTTPKKSVRSCKGKKYQELMSSGQMTVASPKKMVPGKQLPVTINGVDHHHIIIPPDNISKEDALSPKIVAQSKTIEKHCLTPDSPDSVASPTKRQQFSFVSFDLEDKIKALPAQCLETYLQRKKSTKRKKKINSKKRSSGQNKTETIAKEVIQSPQNQPKTAQEVKEQIVGSQKRKARKESITRRDVNSVQNEVQLLLSSGSINTVYIGGCTTPAPQPPVEINHNITSDLLILAEVAANRTGLAQ